MRLVIAVPVLLVLILFAVSNRQHVAVGFWPTDLDLIVPLAGAVLVPAAAAFLIGGLIVWPGELRARRRARRAETRLHMLEEEVRVLRAREQERSGAALPPPA
ncbi:MAG TPA: lipopolysaccharide assembly protein LapA domain-containing protein [Acetobacteraceae bacterium]|nr:lipopolysaccharide assembly protein LapA domain-containing protein [Acetobacteraceae bacterium]